MNDVNPYIRQLQIDMITDNHNEILSWFNELWNQLNIIETDVYHKDGGEIIHYTIKDNNKKSIFYQDNKHKIFWVNHENYWSILESKFNLNYTEVRDITKLLVENALNSIIAAPSSGGYPRKKINNVLYNMV